MFSTILSYNAHTATNIAGEIEFSLWLWRLQLDRASEHHSPAAAQSPGLSSSYYHDQHIYATYKAYFLSNAGY